MIQDSKSKILVLVGPTASGKSELAVKLAKKYNGEIISCDSRQIYRDMNIGTGKVAGNWKTVSISSHPERVRRVEGSLKHSKETKQLFIYKNIPHHCIDFVNPKRQYSVAQFQKQAQKAIANIIKRGKLPILCGGTGHWVDAVVYNQTLPDVKPNQKLRNRLEKKSAEDLFEQLQKLDSHRATTIDRHNKRRLIRALEIILSTGKPVPSTGVIPNASEGSQNRDSSSSDAFGLRMTPYDTLWIGINPSQEELYEKIDKRLAERFRHGMTSEVQKLHKQGLSWKKLESFGLEYKYIALHLQKKLSKEELREQLSFAIKHYAKRQRTWFKRNKNIVWLNNTKKAGTVVEKFLQ